MALISFTAFGGERAIIACLFGWAMLAIATSDAKHFIIPDALSLPSIPLGLVATYVLAERTTAAQAVFDHTLAAVTAFGFLWLVRKAYHTLRQTQGLGFGDVKLGAVAGAWNGLDGATHTLLAACILAIAYVIFSAFFKHREIRRTSVLPLGVFLAPAIWTIWCLTDVSAQENAYQIGAAYLIVAPPVG